MRWPWQRKNSVEITDSWTLFGEWLDRGRAKSGAAVNVDTALQAQAVLACARVIAEGLAQVPLKVYRPRAGGGFEEARDTPLFKVLHRQANEFQTSFEWREMAGLHLALTNRHYSLINRVLGEVVELLPFEPGQVTVTRAKDWSLSYQVRRDDGTSMPVPAENMLHLRGPSWNGYEGLDALRLARESVGLSLQMEEHAARFFSNGANGGDIISTDQPLKQEQVDRLRAEWKKHYSGTNNAFKTAIMWGGMKWQSRATDNKLAQLYELRGFQVEDICQRFRVNPIMIGFSGDKTPTYASAEQLFLAHVVYTMGPWYERLEQAFDMRLLSRRQQDAGFYTKHTVAGLLRGAHKDRSEYFARALGAGGAPAWMTQDEVRAKEDLNPMGGTAAELPVATNVGGPPPEETE